MPSAVNPAILHTLPASLRDPFITAFTGALHPVFLMAAGIAVLGFAMALFLPEMPLRRTTAAEGMSESFAAPRPSDSLAELKRFLVVLADRNNHWKVYQEFATRAGVKLPPQEIWLIGRIAERAPVTSETLAADLVTPWDAVEDQLGHLRRRGLVAVARNGTISLTEDGQRTVDKLTAARRANLVETLAGWKPEQHADIRAMLDELAATLTREMPQPRGT